MVTAEVSRLTNVEGGPVTGYSADIRVRCAQCDLPFRWMGLPGGLSRDQPATSLAGDELRAPIEPMDPELAARLDTAR